MQVQQDWLESRLLHWLEEAGRNDVFIGYRLEGEGILGGVSGNKALLAVDRLLETAVADCACQTDRDQRWLSLQLCHDSRYLTVQLAGPGRCPPVERAAVVYQDDDGYAMCLELDLEKNSA